MLLSRKGRRKARVVVPSFGNHFLEQMERGRLAIL